jgi:hypothetical protein
MQLGRDIGQHLQKARPPQRARGSQPRRLLGDPIEQRDVLGYRLAVVEHERGDVALGVDSPEIRPRPGALGVDVDGLFFEAQSRLDERDVVGQAAGARRIVEFHGSLLCACWLMTGCVSRR